MGSGKMVQVAPRERDLGARAPFMIWEVLAHLCAERKRSAGMERRRTQAQRLPSMIISAKLSGQRRWWKMDEELLLMLGLSLCQLPIGVFETVSPSGRFLLMGIVCILLWLIPCLPHRVVVGSLLPKGPKTIGERSWIMTQKRPTSLVSSTKHSKWESGGGRTDCCLCSCH